MTNPESARQHGFRNMGTVALLLVVGLALLVAPSCSSRSKRADLASNDPEFKTKTDDLAKAYAALSVDQVMSFYTPDTYSLSFDLPYKFDTGAGPHRVRLERFLGTIDHVKVTTAPNVEVWKEEDRVWTTRSFSATGALKNGDTFHFDGVFSAIWEKRGNRWGIVYEHFWGPWDQVGRAAAPPPAAVLAPPPPAPIPSLEDNLNDIFFDYDKWDIREDQVPVLTANALVLKQHPNAVVAIEGRCDERAGLGYNKTLGEKRAEETKKYLVSLGIEPERMQTVAVGKLPPYVAGTGEPIWSQNRRAHFVVLKK